MRPGRRQGGVERRHGRAGQGGEAAVELGKAVRRQHAGAAAVGEDRKPLAGEPRMPRQDLGGAEEILQVGHAQQACAPERGFVGGIGAGERAGVGQGGPGARCLPAGLDDDHGFGSRGPACRREELPRMRHRLHVEQDGAALRVAGEIVEEVAEVGVSHVAERDDV